MSTDEEAQETLKDKTNKGLSAEEELPKDKTIEAEKPVEKNPDIEDPRLFSPLQEPDRPDSQERCSEEKENSENHAD